MTAAFPSLPVGGGDPREVAAIVNRIAQGKLNCTGSVVLTANATATAVSDARATASSVILLMPTTANAAAELGNGTVFVSARGKGTFTLTHAANAQTDRTFDFAVIG